MHTMQACAARVRQHLGIWRYAACRCIHAAGLTGACRLRADVPCMRAVHAIHASLNCTARMARALSGTAAPSLPPCRPPHHPVPPYPPVPSSPPPHLPTPPLPHPHNPPPPQGSSLPSVECFPQPVMQWTERFYGHVFPGAAFPGFRLRENGAPPRGMPRLCVFICGGGVGWGEGAC